MDIKKTIGLVVLLATCVTIPLAMAGHPWLEENNWVWPKDRSKPSWSYGFGSRSTQFSYKDNFLPNEYKHQYNWRGKHNLTDWECEFNWTDWRDRYNLTDWKYEFNWTDWKDKYNMTDWDHEFNMSDCMSRFNFSDYTYPDFRGVQADVAELQTQVEQLTEEKHNQDLHINELEARIDKLESALADALEKIETLEG